MDIEETITKIIEKTGLTRVEIQQKIDQQIEDLSGLIDEEGAIIIVAKNLDIDLKEHQELSNSELDTPIERAKPRTNVNLVGRISETFDPGTFNRKDGSQGKFLKFIIQDNTASIRCIAWDVNADIANENAFTTNEIIRIVNGFVKEGRDGGLEVHIGSKSRIQLQPDQVDMTKLPSKIDADTTITPLSELNLINPFFTIEEQILSIYPITEFQRKQAGTTGKRGSIAVGTPANIVYITFWNDLVSEMEGLTPGQTVKITHLSPKKNYKDNTKIDLSATSKSKVSITQSSGEGSSLQASDSKGKTTPIKILTAGENMGTIEGIVQRVDPVREVNLKSGGTKPIQSLIVADETDSIRLNLWGEQIISDIKENDAIRCINVQSKLNSYSNQMEGNIRFPGTALIIDKQISGVVSVTAQPSTNALPSQTVKIKDLINNRGYFTVECKVQEVEDIREISLKNGTKKQIQSISIADETDAIRMNIWEPIIDPSLQVGDTLRLEGVYAKLNSYSNQYEASLSRTGSITKISLQLETVKTVPPKTTRLERGAPLSADPATRAKISDITKDGYYQFKGAIVKDITQVTLYDACSKCNKKISNCTCDPIGEQVPRLILNLILDDESGVIRGTMMGNLGERLLGETTETLYTLKERGDLETLLKMKNQDLVGKEFLFKGRARYSSYSEKYEITLNDYQEVNLTNETKFLIELLEAQ